MPDDEEEFLAEIGWWILVLEDEGVEEYVRRRYLEA